jgi:hypothetical protein
MRKSLYIVVSPLDWHPDLPLGRFEDDFTILCLGCSVDDQFDLKDVKRVCIFAVVRDEVSALSAPSWAEAEKQLRKFTELGIEGEVHSFKPSSGSDSDEIAEGLLMEVISMVGHCQAVDDLTTKFNQKFAFS